MTPRNTDRRLRAAVAESPRRRVEELDVEGLLDFADEVLADAARIWVEAASDTKRRFEQALYPDGVVYDPDEAFRTVPKPLVFRPLELEEDGKSRVVAPEGRKSNPLVDWLVRLTTLEGALALASRDGASA